MTGTYTWRFFQDRHPASRANERRISKFNLPLLFFKVLHHFNVWHQLTIFNCWRFDSCFHFLAIFRQFSKNQRMQCNNSWGSSFVYVVAVGIFLSVFHHLCFLILVPGTFTAYVYTLLDWWFKLSVFVNVVGVIIDFSHRRELTWDLYQCCLRLKQRNFWSQDECLIDQGNYVVWKTCECFETMQIMSFFFIMFDQIQCF